MMDAICVLEQEERSFTGTENQSQIQFKEVSRLSARD